jgi:hypothetical protein
MNDMSPIYVTSEIAREVVDKISYSEHCIRNEEKNLFRSICFVDCSDIILKLAKYEFTIKHLRRLHWAGTVAYSSNDRNLLYPEFPGFKK